MTSATSPREIPTFRSVWILTCSGESTTLIMGRGDVAWISMGVVNTGRCTGRIVNALQKAIEQVEAGNFLILIDGQDGKQNLLGWLKELQELREQQAVHKRQQYMESLTCFYGLT